MWIGSLLYILKLCHLKFLAFQITIAGEEIDGGKLYLNNLSLEVTYVC